MLHEGEWQRNPFVLKTLEQREKSALLHHHIRKDIPTKAENEQNNNNLITGGVLFTEAIVGLGLVNASLLSYDQNLWMALPEATMALYFGRNIIIRTSNIINNYFSQDF